MTRTFDHSVQCWACKTQIAAGEQVEVEQTKNMMQRYVDVYRHADRGACSSAEKARRAQAQIERELTAAGAAHRATLATDKQVRYALVLQDSASPYERYTEAQLASMSRAEISQLINLLLSNG